MRFNRVYIAEPLSEKQSLTLPLDASRHLLTVLKMQSGQSLILFNGDGNQFLAQISATTKKSCSVEVLEKQRVDVESPLNIHLIQGISRGDKMDLTIQKSVELGVNKITPLLSERCGVKLSAERLEKKMQHWRKIIISACEQCGRNRLPELAMPITFQTLMAQGLCSSYLILNPHLGNSIRQLENNGGAETLACSNTNSEINSNSKPNTSISSPLKQNGSQSNQSFHLIIGPEGGLSDSEVLQAEDLGCQSIQLGPRILRTETAGLTAISLLQGKFGDL